MTREQVARLFPDWELSRGTDRLCHGRLRETPAVAATGEDWQDLADQMRRADARYVRTVYGIGETSMST